MVHRVKVGDEVETQNGTRVYVTHIQYSNRDGCEWYQGIDTNGRVHVAIKEFLCHKTGRHNAVLEKWLLDEKKGE